jgi:hypothetical protein
MMIQAECVYGGTNVGGHGELDAVSQTFIEAQYVKDKKLYKLLCSVGDQASLVICVSTNNYAIRRSLESSGEERVQEKDLDPRKRFGSHNTILMLEKDLAFARLRDSSYILYTLLLNCVIN